MRWGAGLALLALMPKCVVCVAVYLGLATALGLQTRPEMCGIVAQDPAAWLPLAGAGILATAIVALRRRNGCRVVRAWPGHVRSDKYRAD